MKLVLTSMALAVGTLITPAAAQVTFNDNVCVVTFNDTAHAAKRDVRAIATASVMPREYAVKMLDTFIKIFDYPNQAASISACQCLGNPVPANSMAERYHNVQACPKPDHIE